jgi:hypothetical protein
LSLSLSPDEASPEESFPPPNPTKSLFLPLPSVIVSGLTFWFVDTVPSGALCPWPTPSTWCVPVSTSTVRDLRRPPATRDRAPAARIVDGLLLPRIAEVEVQEAWLPAGLEELALLIAFLLDAAIRRGDGSFPREEDELESSDSRASNDLDSWPSS